MMDQYNNAMIKGARKAALIKNTPNTTQRTLITALIESGIGARDIAEQLGLNIKTTKQWYSCERGIPPRFKNSLLGYIEIGAYPFDDDLLDTIFKGGELRGTRKNGHAWIHDSR